VQVIVSDRNMLQSYLAYLRKTFFSTFAPPEGMSEFQDLLDQLSKTTKPALVQGRIDPSLPEGGGPNLPAEVTSEYHLAGKQRNSLYVVPLGAQYAALLSICSAKCWLAPPLLAEVSGGNRKLGALKTVFFCLTHDFGCRPWLKSRNLLWDRNAGLRTSSIRLSKIACISCSIRPTS